MTDFNILYPDKRHTGKTVLRQAQLVMLRMLCIIDHICKEHDLKYWLCSGTLLGAFRHKGFIPWDDDLDICMLREDYEKFIAIAQKELPDDIFVQTRETDKLYDYLPLPCKVRDKKSLILSEGFENKKYNMGIFVDIFPADRYHADTQTLKKEKRLKTLFFLLSKGADLELSRNKSLFRRLLGYTSPIFKQLLSLLLKRTQLISEENKQLGDNCLIGPGLDTPWRRYFKPDEIFPIKEIEFEGLLFMCPNNPESYLTQVFGPDYMTPPPIEEQVAKHAMRLKPIL